MATTSIENSLVKTAKNHGGPVRVVKRGIERRKGSVKNGVLNGRDE
jgi:hypothetical protein